MPIWQNLYTFSNIYEQTAAAAQHSQLDQEERKEDGRFAVGHIAFGQIWPQRRGNSFLKPHNSSFRVLFNFVKNVVILIFRKFYQFYECHK